jgi:hypothetical protein
VPFKVEEVEGVAIAFADEEDVVEVDVVVEVVSFELLTAEEADFEAFLRRFLLSFLSVFRFKTLISSSLPLVSIVSLSVLGKEEGGSG